VTEFKTGDRVKFIGTLDDIPIGTVGTVKMIEAGVHWPIYVDFDNGIKGAPLAAYEIEKVAVNNQIFKVGDKVRFIDNAYPSHLGKTAVVTNYEAANPNDVFGYREAMVFVEWDDKNTAPGRGWYATRFEKIEDAPAAFKVGDRVKFIDADFPHYVGKVATVNRIGSGGFGGEYIYVTWDNVSPYDGGGWLPKRFEKITDTVKPGDRVEYTGSFSTELVGFKGTVKRLSGFNSVEVEWDGKPRYLNKTNTVYLKNVTALPVEEPPAVDPTETEKFVKNLRDLADTYEEQATALEAAADAARTMADAAEKIVSLGK
jgi:hypothetical protein